MPSDPRRGDLWPENYQWGGGIQRGQLLLEDCKSTSLIGYHSPFPYPHLCNWRIDQLDLCTLLAAGRSLALEAGCEMLSCSFSYRGVSLFVCACVPHSAFTEAVTLTLLMDFGGGYLLGSH